MHISIKNIRPEVVKTGLLIIPVPPKSAKLPAAAAAVDKTLGGELARAFIQEKFEGRDNETLVIRTAGRLPAAKVMLLGAGTRPVGPAAMRRLAALAVRKARAEKAADAAMVMDGLTTADNAFAAAEGALLGEYRFLKYKGEEAKKGEGGTLGELVLLVGEKNKLAAAEKAARLGVVHARAAIFARDLVNEPAAVTTPGHLKDVAVGLAKAQPKRISIKVFDETELKKMGAGGLLAVARGSDEPPYLVHLTYKPAKKARRRVALVGKGLCFDSGGLSLKPAEGMEDMKIDMSGAAAVLGVFSAIAELAPPVEVHGIIGLCENMPSGKALKPGDVVRTMSGKTIEVLNTDAEGRVTLADTIHYARGLKPDHIVDLATLTGACMVALGQEVAGLMTNSDKLAVRLCAASAAAGEPIWRLPLVKEYKELLKSRVADLQNITKLRYGGAITAGLFLQEFAGDASWAHLDIAGPAWEEHDVFPWQPIGGTGYGVRTMLRFISSLS